MSKPTKAQRSILDRLAADKEMRVGQYGTVFIASDRGRLNDTVLPVTVAVLLREGWVACWDRIYTITPAGRAALDGSR